MVLNLNMKWWYILGSCIDDFRFKKKDCYIFHLTYQQLRAKNSQNIHFPLSRDNFLSKTRFLKFFLVTEKMFSTSIQTQKTLRRYD